MDQLAQRWMFLDVDREDTYNVINECVKVVG